MKDGLRDVCVLCTFALDLYVQCTVDDVGDIGI